MKDSVDSVLERVQKIIARQLGVEIALVTPDARFREDLGADSIDLVELTMAFSSDFGGVLDDDARQIQTVGELVSYIERKGKQKDRIFPSGFSSLAIPKRSGIR